MSVELEFGTRDEANAVREEYEGQLCPVDDDRRRKTVALVSDVDDDTLQSLRTRADASRAERQGSGGQAALTDGERNRIDFSVGRASVPHARSVKGIARDAGVDDWTSYYDPKLTVDEHRDVMDRAARDESGQRMDAERTDEQRAADLEAQAGGECNHAEDHCEHGDPEACEFLSEHCGVSEEHVASLLDDDTDGDLPGPVYGAFGKQWTRYRAGVANAKEAAAVINEIQEANGQDPIEFDELGERAITKADITW